MYAFCGASSIGSCCLITSPIACSVSRSAASRGSTSSAKTEASDACIWAIVFALST